MSKDEKITWRKAIATILLRWETAKYMKTHTPKPRYKVLTFKEYCENGMSHG